MVHPSYEIVQANTWWGPAPAQVSVAIAEAESPGRLLTFLTVIDQPRAYHVLHCVHPDSRFTRAVVQDLEVQDYSPGDDFESENPCREYYEELWHREAGSFVHRAARARHSWGLELLHYRAEGLRHVLMGEQLVPRAKEDMNSYGQPRRICPRPNRRTRHPYDLLPHSPYAPHGLWTYVPPDHPFDFRVRAQCTIPKTLQPDYDLEGIALVAIDVRRIGEPTLLTSIDHSLFAPLDHNDNRNDDP